MTTTSNRANQDLAAWLMGSIFRAFHCNGCGRPIVAARIEWLNPVYVWSLAVQLGIPIVAHCPYLRCGNGITQHSAPVISH
ncbi:hypothetical protein FB561_0002 [Kribbella amoyensis]|uniref:Uncharacterized protein n=1 Tax=Kribbella amoyensis TaxID=996641 RepID=A0A561BJF0_9ACTN|nr:hypothetical protein [Kribbella amoyensis]TWD78955.1 hypothetical protein FB561_0002 [Kribbella amoyensis]